MTDTYELDATEPAADDRAGDPGDEPPDTPLDESVGVTIPEEHVGAFVAQAFEDVERDTDWADVVDALVSPAAREDWRALDPAEQVAEVLRTAGDYDERAADALEAVSTDMGSLAPDDEERWAEATRLRRNADILRDGVADAYATGRVDDEQLVAAVEAADFDTGTVARREEAVERVANAFALDFRPYGGTLFDGDREPTDEEFTHWD